MPAPTSAHIVTGIIFKSDNINRCDGATVSLTHTNGTLSSTTNTSGEYQFNLADLSSWSRGDTITITATKSKIGTKTLTTSISSGGGQKHNLTLQETSSIEVYTEPYQPVVAVLAGFDGNIISLENPLPVKVVDSSDFGVLDLTNNPSWEADLRSDGQPNWEKVTIRGVTYKRTFTYTNSIMTRRTAWIRQN